MKHIYFAAGALLLSTSAFAWTPSTAPVAPGDKTIAVSDGKAPAVVLAAKWDDLPKVEKISAKLQTESAEMSDKLVTAEPDLDLSVDLDSVKGLGGPLEEVDVSATAASPATSYPPCRPGPGDDQCIQLYEPGVPAKAAGDRTLAAAMGEGSAPIATGKQTGMGGPYEAVETADADAAKVTEAAYPPCAPGPGDDRCIQLYERGVTGN